MIEYGSLKFEEAIESLRGKLNLDSKMWSDVYGEAHAKSFMVAGAKGDVLADFRRAVGRAVNDGITVDAFKKDFNSIVKKHGWDFTGTADWRAEIIYDTNVRQAYNAGRERQMADPALMKRRPYGQYRHGGSKKPRPLHLEKDNWVVRLDNPWWNVWTPQNGWNCTCKKFALSERDVQRLKLKVRTPEPLKTRPVKLANGKVKNVPEGIDPGFEHRPGGDDIRRFYEQMATRADALPAPLKKFVMADLGNALDYVHSIGGFSALKVDAAEELQDIEDKK